MGKLSETQRRWLRMMEEIGPMMSRSLRPATRKKLIDLGFVEICPPPPGREEIRITERGKKYLFNWRRAYGSGVVSRSL